MGRLKRFTNQNLQSDDDYTSYVIPGLSIFYSNHNGFLFFRVHRPSMSQGMMHNRMQEKDFTVATPEEFVRRFGGNKVINKVCIFFFFFLGVFNFFFFFFRC